MNLSEELSRLASVFNATLGERPKNDWVKIADIFLEGYSDEARAIIHEIINNQFSGLSEAGSQHSNGIAVHLRIEAARAHFSPTERDLEGDNV